MYILLETSQGAVDEMNKFYHTVNPSLVFSFVLMYLGLFPVLVDSNGI